MNELKITKSTTLEDLISKFHDNGWIDCTENDWFDGDEFYLVMKYLKELVSLREQIDTMRFPGVNHLGKPVSSKPTSK